MKFSLNDKIIVDRVVIFLCGPYFSGKSDDRRKIIQMHLHKEYQENVLPLIIDDFLSEENLSLSTNVQLLEEIFAAFSHRTYIFLDTISSSSELGLFGNNSFNHGIKVFLPKVSDIHDKENVGYFVRNVILGHDRERIQKIYYRPKITRHPISSDFVKERYGFINNKVPEVIIQSIKEDNILEAIKESDLVIYNSNEIPDDIYKINYQIIDNKLNIQVSVKLLFYITVALVYSEFKTELANKSKSMFTEKDTIDFLETIKFTLSTYIKDKVHQNFGKINSYNIQTKINRPINQIIHHILEFIYVYHTKSSRYHGYNLIKSEKSILKNIDSLNMLPSFIEMFDINEHDYQLVESVYNNPDKYCVTSTIRKENKKREIVKYVESEDGEELRTLHKKMVNKLIENYEFSSASFAYKKGTSTFDCVKKHKDNISFVKLDITKYFNSIRLDNLINRLKKEFNILGEVKDSDRMLFETFFYKGKLPLGLVSSPILSDIYLRDFDDTIIKKLDDLDSGLVFTRYADDMLISKKDIISEELRQQIVELIINELIQYQLELNKSKTKSFTLSKQGDHFRFLGINIVKTTDLNKLTVGKKFIYETAKLFLDYLSKKDAGVNQESKYYTEKIISGRISYIIQIEGTSGFNLLINRIRKSTDMKFKYLDNKIIFD
ncbi:reverse transcriptase domain-containing protein [Fusibacter bizertensis]|uniref:Reverse transcriptase domain-containing protein n=1 Tax=Fusibacter bizertensis TaxID=1488331 RepID=A0ABT6NAH5_9FIRM|nr:reverse transcriptase domain-containing protein [Fusibacter bizertensis]MDH8677416.1 reverse transcriptase domain-containing protein [Fusibacter bizertensis]